MATFNISGCCTMRDAFGFQEKCEHKVIHFLQFSSPVTWFEFITEPEKEFLTSDLDELSVDGIVKNNFTKKCIVNDYNRTVLSYYKDKADYFIFDFPEMVRYGLIKQTINDNRVHYFTSTGRVLKRNSKHMNFLDLLSGNKSLIHVSEYLTDDMIEKILAKLHDWLIYTKGYALKEIILVKTLNALDYYDGTMMRSFPNVEKLKQENALLNKIYTKFECLFDGCHVVEFPTNAYGIVPHKWGLLSLHYSKEIYDYLYGAFDFIANNFSGGVERLYEFTQNMLESNRQRFELQKECTIQQKKLDRINNLSIKLEEILDGSTMLNTEIHFSHIGWQTDRWGKDIEKYSTNYQIEAIKISCMDRNFTGDIFYAAKVGYRKTWTDTYKNGQMVGTVGKKMPINAIKIWLDKKSENEFDIIYRLITRAGIIYETSNGIPIEIGKSEVFTGIYVELKRRTS